MILLRADIEIILTLLIGICLPVSCRAQDDPFAPVASQQVAKPENPVDQPAQPAVLPELSEATKVVVRAVVDSNPQTDVELGKAVKLLLDVEQYDQAKSYLSQLQAIAIDDASLFRVYESLGSDFFLVLHGLPELQPEGRIFAKQVLAAAQRESTKPERVDALIRSLSNPDISVRSTAFRQLRRLGAPVVAEMIHIFADPTRRSEFPGVRSALKLMGNDAIPPLLGAARATNLQVQAEALYALRYYQSVDATEVMMKTYLSPNLPESLRRVAGDSLQKSQSSPVDPAVVEKRFYDKAREYLLGKRNVPEGFLHQVTLWQWNAQTNRLQPVTVSNATAIRLAAAERAADLYEIRPDSAQNRRLFLLAQLEAAKRVIGPGQPVDVDQLVQQYGTEVLEVESILEEAIALGLIPAATACCEILGQIGSADLLFGATSQPRALVKAILVGDRHLQFAAFNAITKLDPQQAFAGSSHVMLLAIYLASSEGRAAGLIGHVRPDIAQSYAATLRSADLFGVAANTSREFFRAAIRDPDLDILLVSDTLDLPDFAELVQQLRNDFRIKRTPIGLLFRNSENQNRVRRLVAADPFLIAIPISLDPEVVASQVRRLRELAQPWPVTDVDRRKHAVAAINWLAHVASHHEVYPFFDFGSHQEELTGLLYLPGFVDAASKILVHVGTPAAQRELLNFASQAGLPIAEREIAVQAFAQAVKAGGTLLTKREILLQYDRYNASENETPETQKVLGSILDAIEARVQESD